MLKTQEVEKTKGDKTSGKDGETNAKGKSSAKKGANQTGYSDDDNESDKTQYLEVNKKHNTELIACK
jgi:hypothetical protein